MPVGLGLAALSALPGLAQAGLGIYQAVQGAKYAKTPRPTYKRPEEITKATELARRQSVQTELPGEKLLRTRLSGKLAEGVSALKSVSDSPVDIQSNITKMVGSQSRALSDVSVQAEQMRLTNMQRFQQALGVQAGYTDKEFQVNKYEPYANAMRAAAMMTSAGTQNISMGADSALAGGLGAYQGSQYLSKLQSYETQWDALRLGNRNAEYGMRPLQTPPMLDPYSNRSLAPARLGRLYDPEMRQQYPKRTLAPSLR